MKTILYSLVLSCSLFVNAAFASAQPLDTTGVVIIKTYKSNEAIGIGTGVVVGTAGNRVFILTARHVWQGSNRQEVLFYKKKYAPFTAKPDRYINMELDIGVLIVELSSDTSIYKDFTKFLKGDRSQLEIFASVTSIGYRKRDLQTASNKIASLSYEDDSRKLTLTNSLIGDGCSGGPLFDEQGRLIGIITHIDAISALAVHIDPILVLLKDWGIPDNLIQKPPVTPCGDISMPLTNRKISFLTTSLGMLTGGTFAWYLTAKKKADDKFAAYRAATSTEEAVSHRIQTEKARARRNVAGYVSIGSGGLFAIMLVRDLLRCKPQKSDSLAQSPVSKKVGNRLGFKLNGEPDEHTISLNVHLNF